MNINITNMSEVATMTQPPIGIFSDETMCRDVFAAYVAGVVGRKNVRPSVRLIAPYYSVEYLNSPSGLIVLAHHDTIDGQVDGIHPKSIGESIASSRIIVEPLKGICPESPAYSIHYMTRRSQGALVLKAFGRMVHGGDDEAHCVDTEKYFSLEIYNTKVGPIVGAIENDDRVCVIRPDAS